MTKVELIHQLQTTTGASFITCTELCKFLGKQNQSRVKREYLYGLDRIGKAYFIPDVAQRLMDGRES